jgi:hypothetical protein
MLSCYHLIIAGITPPFPLVSPTIEVPYPMSTDFPLGSIVSIPLSNPSLSYNYPLSPKTGLY